MEGGPPPTLVILGPGPQAAWEAAAADPPGSDAGQSSEGVLSGTSPPPARFQLRFTNTQGRWAPGGRPQVWAFLREGRCGQSCSLPHLGPAPLLSGGSEIPSGSDWLPQAWVRVEEGRHV